MLHLSPCRSLSKKCRYEAQAVAAEIETPSTPPSPNATLPVSLAAVQGTYRNLGYGADIELCATSAGSSLPHNCTSLVAQLNGTFPVELAAADLVWAWNKLEVTYVTLSHFEGSLFNMTGWIALVSYLCTSLTRRNPRIHGF